jgi:beta-lactamase class D
MQCLRRLVTRHQSTRLLPAAVVLMMIGACTPEPKPAPAPEPEPESAPPIVEREVDLTAFFPGLDPDDATFVVLNAQSGEIVRYNPARAARRFVPASTFKIPNSLIALETGVASGADHRIAWDSVRPNDGSFWAASWSADHTLRSAMRNSVYWYYQVIAREIGADRMQSHLDRFDYGNRDMAGGVDVFWLRGDLRISPDEQVRFLRRMYDNDLGISEESTRIVKDIIVLESDSTYRLSGKTGTAGLGPTRTLAWLVGYVEKPGETSFFALNMEGEDVWERWGNPDARLGLVRELLQAVGTLE